MKSLANVQGLLIFALSVFSALAYYFLAYELDRSCFKQLITCFSFTFIAYFFFYQIAKRAKTFWIFVFLGIFFRLLFLFSTPSLSDDYFRFIWDGQLTQQGINPFQELPTEIKTDIPNQAVLLNGMNSQGYYSVYPPIAQGISALSVLLSPKNLDGNILSLRSILLLFELGTIVMLVLLLQKLKMPQYLSLFYILNPLVIVEISGNLHFEGVMIFFFLIAFYLLIRGKVQLSSLFWAFAAATKLIPLLFLPILLRQQKVKRLLVMGFIFILSFLLLWIPFFSPLAFSHFKQSLNLYFETFEFNAGLYYLLRWLGYQFAGYNIIQTAGFWLSKIALLGVVLILLRKKRTSWADFFTTLLLALSWYYAFALIVHPWYICSLVALSVFSPYRYAILWSALIPLSYFAYSNAEFNESYWLISIEYLAVVAFLILELKEKKWHQLKELSPFRRATD